MCSFRMHKHSPANSYTIFSMFFPSIPPSFKSPDGKSCQCPNQNILKQHSKCPKRNFVALTVNSSIACYQSSVACAKTSLASRGAKPCPHNSVACGRQPGVIGSSSGTRNVMISKAPGCAKMGKGLHCLISFLIHEWKSKCWALMSCLLLTSTLSAIIMEWENGCIWKVTNIKVPCSTSIIM